MSLTQVTKTSLGIYPNFIDGEWTAPEAVRTHENRDPAHLDRVLGLVPETPASEVDRACQAAERDFEGWRRISGDARVKIFYRLAELLKTHEDELSRLITREMGKSLFDAHLDVREGIGVCEALAPQGMSVTGRTYPNLVPGLAMESRLAPRGVAGIITPFNFPCAIPLAQIVAALITGNTVVWKAAHLVPESSQVLAKLILAAFADSTPRWVAGVPRGVFQLVQGDEGTGDALCRHPAVRAVSFTGSKAVGDKVDGIASGLGKRVMKETGGINCFYVHQSADLERAARSFLYGKTISSGQRCTSIQEVLVDRSVEQAFLAKVRGLVGGIVYGPGDSEEVARAHAEPPRVGLPPLVTREARDRVLAWRAQSLAEGARLLVEVPVPEKLAAQGAYAPFSVLGDVGPQNLLHDHEVFGPIAVWTPVSGIAEAIRIINTKIGIVACIDAQDKNASETFIDRVLRTRIDDGRHGTGCFWATKFGGDRGAGSGNPALDEDMVYGYLCWKTIYRAYTPVD
jgi:acyl-CoA reductase-like NAD-dependent aldehyde dehydrogenase